MRFENTKVYNIEGALRGMRNPMNSWDKSDSGICKGGSGGIGCANCARQNVCKHTYDLSYQIGKKDMLLAQKLIRAGSEHRKFLRQIFVSVDITAPAYFMAELDTYKIGVTRNSSSFMHRGVAKPFEQEDFECDSGKVSERLQAGWKEIIDMLNFLRNRFLETGNDQYFRAIRQLLPQSYLYRSTITMNYENLYTIINQRKNHKLNEWSGKDNPGVPNFIAWARTLPYAHDFLFID